MKRLVVPAYGWRVARELTRYVMKTAASDPWKSGKQAAKSFKAEMTRLMLVEQSRRCAYCGSRLFEKHPHRDHIAPKEKYARWTFWPENLVLACFACNTDLKKSFDPVVAVGRTYRQTKFSIVHPFLDDPVEHLGFAADDLKVLISSANSSAKGKQTIELFDLASADRAKQRAKDAIFDDDVGHLHGKWLELYKAAAQEILSKHFVSGA